MDQGYKERERRYVALFEAHYRQVLAYALRRADNASDAEEVAAETFTVVWRRLDDVPNGDDALLWIYGVARLVLSNSRRSRRRRRFLEDKLASLPVERVEFEDTVSGLVDRQAVRDALSRLKPHDQELLRLVAWEGLSHRQVAQMLGCTENAVAIRLHRARERLAAEMAKDARRNGQKRNREEPPTPDPGGEDHH